MLLFSGGCSKDPSLYREYAYGNTYLQQTLDGEPVPGCLREVIHFNNYTTFSIALVTQDSLGLHDNYFTNGWYSIYINEFSTFISVNDHMMSDVWDIERFTEDDLKATVLSRVFDSDTAALSGKVVEFTRMDRSVDWSDTLAGTWDLILRNDAACADFSVSFNKDGKYRFYLPEEGEWVEKKDEKGAFVLYGNFLRLSFFNNTLWGPENLYGLTGWTLGFYTEDKVRYMRWESLDTDLSYTFAPRT